MVRQSKSVLSDVIQSVNLNYTCSFAYSYFVLSCDQVLLYLLYLLYNTIRVNFVQAWDASIRMFLQLVFVILRGKERKINSATYIFYYVIKRKFITYNSGFAFKFSIDEFKKDILK